MNIIIPEQHIDKTLHPRCIICVLNCDYTVFTMHSCTLIVQQTKHFDSGN